MTPDSQNTETKPKPKPKLKPISHIERERRLFLWIVGVLCFVWILAIVAVVIKLYLSPIVPTIPNASASQPVQTQNAMPVVMGSATTPLCNAIHGDLKIGGSATMDPLNHYSMSLMQSDGKVQGTIDIKSTETHSGLGQLCDGKIDISGASRLANSDEQKYCVSKGLELIGLQVGYDAITLIVQNTPNTKGIDNLSLLQIRNIFSGNAIKWSVVDPSWPTENIITFVPIGGTSDVFSQKIFDPKSTGLKMIPGAGGGMDDNIIVSSVSSTPYSIGFVGYSYYYNNRQNLKAISIDNIAPGKDTVYDKYILGRPLYLYSTKEMIESKKEVQDFLGCYLHYADIGKLYDNTGFFSSAKGEFIQSIQVFNGILGK